MPYVFLRIPIDATRSMYETFLKLPTTLGALLNFTHDSFSPFFEFKSLVRDSQDNYLKRISVCGFVIDVG